MSNTGIHTNSPRVELSITNPWRKELSDGLPLLSFHFAVPVFPTSVPDCSYGLNPAGMVGLLELAGPPSTVLFSWKYPLESGFPGSLIVADLLVFVTFPNTSFAHA